MINRIILIGNGFDLAHGMKTRYKDFMQNYWKNSFTEYYNSPETIYKCEEFEIATILKKNFETYLDYLHYVIKNKDILKIENRLFIEFSEQHHLTDWVDIETSFYNRLLKSEATGSDNNVKNINKDFEKIKLLLEKHLKEEVLKRKEVDKSISDLIKEHFYGYIFLQDLSEKGLMNVTDILWSRINGYVGPEKDEQLNPADLSKFEWDIVKEIGHILFDKNFLFKHLKEKRLTESVPLTFLNFNYTDTEQNYYEEMDDVIHIHGELDNPINRMIFGYGDELDDNFNVIEKLNNNDYLENIKSINYSRTNNYKRLLKTIDSGMYQVLVVGHSCGNTDRTLLNTIFEHKNCVSVKILYHEDSPSTDNYIEVYKNISRNFNNKAMLRDRVVNKTYSEPLIPFLCLNNK